MKIATFVINLPSADSRRNLIKAQLEFLKWADYEIIPAVDGKKQYPNGLGHVTPGEVGCAMSHLDIYQRIVSRNIPVALIFEDDALIGQRLPELIETLVNHLSSSLPQVILLSHVERYSLTGAKRITKLHRLAKPYVAYGAHAYLITYAGAESLLNNLIPVRVSADAWKYFMKQDYIDVRCVVPYPVGTAPCASTSQIGNERYQKNLKQTWQNLARKYIFQKFIFQIFTKPLNRIRRQKQTW